ncbi:ribosomal assembly complex component [Hirsutella rhossiliensis]|uniref:Pre-rRNA-processing protein IPI3 n=1 Tax=Hirsutella rhossiliensis TaxID=111463 RepID=A0A9P8SGH8_9HYPO|nr:ribosomal assembly complex component [Hirsutella rhossiliensis]KAH0961801.1 ribosomal assembly complex component [Hirsutella rhossiliensis]
MVLSEVLFSSTCGPPISANTAVSRDVGVHGHAVSPSWAVKAAFKKSSAPPRCLAVSDSHVFAAQDQKAHVHVYSRPRGNQEALVPFQERIRCLALAGDVLVLGTAEGRLILWETCTGRQATTPPCHVQAVSCLAVTPFHLLSASDDSNINVWSLARLLEFGADVGHEPDRILSNHRAAITDLVVGPSTHASTSLCVSASKDKTCILWNHQSGQLLRTLLFPAVPLCISLDPCARALFAGAEDGGLYLVELFGDKPLLGSRSAELASSLVQVDSPLGVADADVGAPSCLALSYDGTLVFTGHPKGKIMRWTLTDDGHPAEMANLNAAVTNLVFVPLVPEERRYQVVNVVKPNQTQRQYTFTARLQGLLDLDAQFTERLDSTGIHSHQLETAIASLVASAPSVRNDSYLQKEIDELRSIVEEQKALHKATVQYEGAPKA